MSVTLCPMVRWHLQSIRLILHTGSFLSFAFQGCHFLFREIDVPFPASGGPGHSSPSFSRGPAGSHSELEEGLCEPLSEHDLHWCGSEHSHYEDLSLASACGQHPLPSSPLLKGQVVALQPVCLSLGQMDNCLTRETVTTDVCLLGWGVVFSEQDSSGPVVCSGPHRARQCARATGSAPSAQALPAMIVKDVLVRSDNILTCLQYKP